MADDDHGKSIKNEAQYEALREQGASKEKAARIANADNPGKKGGQADPYEQWTLEALYERAQEIGIDGRSGMNKDQLIRALREH
ncbi:Rho termination factor N-terminal domain-containing protein [uncultured Salinisphaera sp.]|uniref:DUF7218 family protein n=1 Tax=uncultured Salinisphaera sp. TaxID=359372 RepID=UPI0032B2D768|tara:strand:- start:3167 stop:3418 length:252 start_codon:yes stop_codon:yes gene_type:complete